MPRYYFNIHDLPPTLDEVGCDLRDDDAAWREATVLAGALFRDVDGKVGPGLDWGVDAADQNHKLLFRIRISTEVVG